MDSIFYLKANREERNGGKKRKKKDWGGFFFPKEKYNFTLSLLPVERRVRIGLFFFFENLVVLV